MTVFGNGAFKEEMKIQCGHEGGALIHYDWCPWKRTHTRDARAQRRGLGRNQPYWSLDLGEDKFLLFKPLSVWYFVWSQWTKTVGGKLNLLL